MEIENENLEIKKLPPKELRVKFSTDIPELKLKENIQSMIIKSSLTRAELLGFIAKLTKYTGRKNLEIFVANEKLFFENEITLSEFIIKENINFEEKLLEIFFTYEMEEPKLIDSKKQDEWIKKLNLIKFDSYLPGIISVGLFNSEINFFNAGNHEKIVQEYSGEKVIDESDYLFLNDYCFSNSFIQEESKNTITYKSLLVSSIRDYENSLVLKEVQIKGNKDKKEKEKEKRKNSVSSESGLFSNFSIKTKDNYLVGKKDYEYSTLTENNFINKNQDNKSTISLIAATEESGSVHFYEIKHSYLEEEKIEKEKKRTKNHSVNQTILPISELKVADNEIHCFTWMDSSLFATGDLNQITISNYENLSLLNKFNVNSHLVTSIDSIENKILLSSHDNGSFKLWDVNVNSGLISNVTKAHKGWVTQVKSLDSQGRKILTAGYDGEIKIWDSRKLDRAYYSFSNQSEDTKNQQSKIFSILTMPSYSLNNKTKLASGGSSSELDFFLLDC